MSSDEIVIDVKNLSKRYEIYATPRDRLKQLVLPALNNVFSRLGLRPRAKIGQHPPQYFREFWALHDVSFQVRRGETVGIVGLNGSGKSTLLQLICSTLTPTSGNVEVKGRVAALLELGSGFNPDYTGRENVFLNGQILGLSREEIQDRFQAIEAFADIGDFIDRPVKTYSSGMAVRLAFAVAVNVNPKLLVVDEALAVGDIAFQRKCMAWMESFTREGGTLLFVSHSPEQIRRLCSKAIYLQKGRIIALDSAKTICDIYEKDLYGSTPKLTNAVSKQEKSAGHTEHGDEIPILPFAECAVNYGNGQAEILSVWTQGMDGLRKSSFLVGEPFFWVFAILIKADINSPVFGMQIKTKEGITLYGANTSLLAKGRSFLEGETVTVRVKVNSHLGSGEYFLNCGIRTDSDDDLAFIARVVDAAIISFSSLEKNSTGLIDMETHFSYESWHTNERH